MNKLIVFVLGAAAGSLLTWKLLDEKYRRMAEDEIEAMEEYYENLHNIKNVETFEEPIENPSVTVVQEEPKKFLNEKKPLTYYYDKVQKMGYDITPEDGFSIKEAEDGSIWVGPGEEYIDPYVIPPDRFEEIEHYDSKSWTYYSDSVLTNEYGEVVNDPENIIGDALSRFGEYEDDAIHVRNDNNECDYEIIKIEESFAELNRRTLNGVPPRS